MKLIRFLLHCSKGIRHSRLTIALVILTGILSGLINTALLAFINASISKAGAPATDVITTFAALCVALPVIRFISEILLIRLSAAAIFDLRVQLSRRILSAPLSLLEEMGPHRVLAALTDDIPVITNALTFIPILCMHGAVVIGGLVYLGWLSPLIVVWVLGFVVIGVLSYQLPMLRALKYFKRAREEWDTLFKHFNALTTGTKELKLHRSRREAFFKQLLSPTAANLQQQQVQANTVYMATRSWGQVLVFILVGLLLFFTPAISGVGMPTRAAYILTLLYMMTPLEVILGSLPVIGRANVAAQKVEDLGLSLGQTPPEFSSTSLTEVKDAWNTLELREVTHSYRHELEDHNFILGPLDLTFSPGELVFIVGGNGSGKTTLVKLLTGLYAPEGGEIRLDGRVVRDENREAYRQLFSVVFSDFFLFESFLGLETKELNERARECLVQLQLDHKVQVRDGMLSTTKLSQGQRKRLALMTSYLEDRPIYVFDEWAADQDPLFKEVFYLRLLPELTARGKLVVVITHDDGYYSVADRIIKLDYGRVEYDRYAASLKKTPAEIPVPLG